MTPPTLASRIAGPDAGLALVDVDIVVPVHDEETDLERSVLRLCAYLHATFPFTFRITIADNASRDETPRIADHLARTLPSVRWVRLEQKGRGRALREVWSAGGAKVMAYMDVDLSTDLAAVLPLVAPLISGHSDIAVGSRLSHGSRVVRGPKREIISRCYNTLLRTTLRARFRDAQCGFKAIRSDVAVDLVPLVEDTGWFFDTELLVLAQRAGLRIHEVPVDWVDDPDSSVDIVATALADLRGMWRLGRGLAGGRIPLAALRSRHDAELAAPAPLGIVTQLGRFLAIGVASTIAYVALYLMLRAVTPAVAANAVALVLTAVGNVWANRVLTFGVTGRERFWRHQGQGLVVLGLGLALTSGSLAVLHAVSSAPARATEVAVLVAANLGATLMRFLLYRAWVFRRTEAASS